MKSLCSHSAPEAVHVQLNCKQGGSRVCCKQQHYGAVHMLCEHIQRAVTKCTDGACTRQVCTVHHQAHTALLPPPDELTEVDPMQPAPEQLPTRSLLVPPSALPRVSARPHSTSSPQPTPSSWPTAWTSEMGRRRRDGVGMERGWRWDRGGDRLWKERGWGRDGGGW